MNNQGGIEPNTFAILSMQPDTKLELAACCVKFHAAMIRFRHYKTKENGVPSLDAPYGGYNTSCDKELYNKPAKQLAFDNESF